MTPRVLVLCFILLSSQAAAQGKIAGIVKDAGEWVIPGADVQLDGPSPSVPARKTMTDAAGRYEFPGVAIGTYSVTFTMAGFRMVKREGIAVAQASAVAVDAVLRVAPFSSPPLVVQNPARRCLHGDTESAAEQERREDALAAMRMFARVASSFPGARTSSPSWEEVAASSAVKGLRAQGGLAERIRWGTAEPLPGWGIAWVTSRTKSRFALTDLRDPCGFTYSSEDPNVISGRTQLL